VERGVGLVPRVLISRRYLQDVVGLLDLTERSVILVSYVVSPVVKQKKGAAWAFLEALGRAASRDVGVRVVLERSPRERAGAGAARAACGLLCEMGVDARLGPQGLTLHSKFIVCDGLFAVVGSHNLTNRSLTRNYETSVLTAAREVARELSDSFERLWQRTGAMRNEKRGQRVHRRNREEGSKGR